MTLRFYVDECCQPEIVSAVRRGGWDCGYVREGETGIDDGIVLARAHALGAVLITEDRGIGERLVRGDLTVAGLIVLRLKGFEIEERVERLMAAINDVEARILGHLTIVEPDRVRARPLIQTRPIA